MIDSNIQVIFSICLIIIQFYQILAMTQTIKNIDIAFVGSKFSGKTSLIKRCLDLGFEQNSTQVTMFFQFYSTTVVIGQQTYKCNFIDSRGFDMNQGVSMIPHYKRYHGFIVVYDVSERQSFDNSKKCYEEIVQNCQIENQNVAFVGNKNDMQKQRQVSYIQANDYCLQSDIFYVQTSALRNDNIKKIVERIAKNLICSKKIRTQVKDNNEKQQKKFILSKLNVGQAKKQNCLKRFLAFFRDLF